MQKQFCIYMIRNSVNGKLYVGKTRDVEYRWYEHQYTSRNVNRRSRSYIHSAIAKHGANKFEIATVAIFDNEQDAFALERELITQLKNNNYLLYNLSDGGEGASGCIQSEETKRKRALAQTGPRNHRFGKSRNGAVAGDKNPMAKLTWSEVHTIRALRETGVSVNELAKQFKVDERSIRGICAHKTWKIPSH